MLKSVLLIIAGFSLYAAIGAAYITRDAEPVTAPATFPACTYDIRWPYDCVEQSA